MKQPRTGLTKKELLEHIDCDDRLPEYWNNKAQVFFEKPLSRLNAQELDELVSRCGFMHQV